MKKLIKASLAILALSGVSGFSHAVESGSRDSSVQVFGYITDENATISGGYGMVVWDDFKVNLNLSLSGDGDDNTTVFYYAEGQYYLGDLAEAENFIFSVGAGVAYMNSERENTSSSEGGYNVFLQANQFFDSAENASIFYRLQGSQFGDGDMEGTLQFGLEIFF